MLLFCEEIHGQAETEQVLEILEMPGLRFVDHEDDGMFGA